MKEQYILPNRCKKCGATFDLWYELLESEERLDSEEIQDKLGKKLAESLCWGCKKQVLNVIRGNKEEDESLDEFFLDLEY